jgi:hypothetical protein
LADFALDPRPALCHFAPYPFCEPTDGTPSVAVDTDNLPDYGGRGAAAVESEIDAGVAASRTDFRGFGVAVRSRTHAGPTILEWSVS